MRSHAQSFIQWLWPLVTVAVSCRLFLFWKDKLLSVRVWMQLSIVLLKYISFSALQVCLRLHMHGSCCKNLCIRYMTTYIYFCMCD